MPSSFNSTSDREPAFPGVSSDDAYVNGAAAATTAVEMGLGGRLLISFSTVCGFFLFLALAIWLEKRRERAARSAAVAAAAARQQEVDDPVERYRNIEKWLVTKRVEAHDGVCETVLQALVPASMRDNKNKDNICDNDKSKDPPNHPARKCTVDNRATTDFESINDINSSSSSSSSTDEQHEECSICFEAFRVGELISWSANPKCSHVYHHICVKEWLRKNKECPYCREIFLPIDRHQGSVMTLKKINELILAQQTRSAHCYYCLEHGVIRPPSHYSRKHVNTETFVQIQQRSEHLPSLDELSKVRGVACCEVAESDEHCHPGATAAPTTAVLSSHSSADSSDDDEQSLGGAASNTFLGEDDFVIAEEPEYDDGEDYNNGGLQSAPTTTYSLRSDDLAAPVAVSSTTAMNNLEEDRHRRRRRRRRPRRIRRLSPAETQLDTVTPHETWGYHLP